MSVVNVLNQALDNGVLLFLEGDRLKYKVKEGGNLTDELKISLQTYKQDIIQYLQQLYFFDSVDSSKSVIFPRKQEDLVPLSFAQESLWLLENIDAEHSVFNMPFAFSLDGNLNIQALNFALNKIVIRHEILRTVYKSIDGVPYQFVLTDPLLNVKSIDLCVLTKFEQEQEVNRLSQAEAQDPFDLSTDLMLRACLIKLADARHVLLFTMHHIASDGWSMKIFYDELSALYCSASEESNNSLPPLSLQYADYASWQRQYLQKDVLQDAMDYWREHLRGIPPLLQLPYDKVRPAQMSRKGSAVRQTLSSTIQQGLHKTAIQNGATLFMVLHAAFASLLSRHSGENDIVIGTSIANREQAGIEPLIGFFMNMLLLRATLAEDMLFSNLLKQCKEDLIKAYEYQQLPFDKLVDELKPERSLSHTPLFQVAMVLQNNKQGEFKLPGVDISPLVQQYDVAKYDLTVFITENADGFSLYWEYATDLFHSETIERMAQHFEVSLLAIIENSNVQLGELPLLADDEKNKVFLEWNNTNSNYPKNLCIHELFEQQVVISPEAPVILFGQQQLTYRQLNERANQLADYLIEQGVMPDQIVGLYIERSIEMVVGILGIIKAGGAYMPLDPDYPYARLQYMLENSQTNIILSHTQLCDRSHFFVEQKIIYLDEQSVVYNLSRRPITNKKCQQLSVNHLAYVIYTSGSTGKPKGVMNEHRALVNRIDWMQKEYSLNAFDTVLQKTPFSFDVSVWEFFWPLVTGARLVIAVPGGHKDPNYLTQIIKQENVTTLHFVPSMLGAILANGRWNECVSVRQVFCSGEALSCEFKDIFYATGTHSELHNLYGPTEAAIDVSYWDCSSPTLTSSSVPIGRPIQNIQLYVLNKNRQLQPIGVPGELHIAGEGLARGYLNQPELTAEKFITHHFSVNNQTRLYKTGDLVRWLPDGSLEFLGRIDQQIKLRGFRVELGEIEHTLLTKKEIQEAVVIVREDVVGDARLTAYIVLDDNESKTAVTEEKNALITSWKNLYDGVYGVEKNDKFALAGWQSSFTGDAIPAEQMDAWVNGIVSRIVNLQPRNIYEIGCGTGLLMFKLFAHCQTYTGIDLSSSVVEELQKRVATCGIRNVSLISGAAHDFSLVSSRDINTIVINSVAQYFPNVDYFLEVIRGSIALIADCGHIIIGDVLNYDLIDNLHLAIALQRADKDASVSDVYATFKENLSLVNELYISPRFFTEIIAKIIGVKDVVIQLKAGHYDNEMTKYRYDIVLVIDKAEEIQNPAPVIMYDWSPVTHNREWLESIIASVTDNTVVIRNIPNSRFKADIRPDMMRQLIDVSAIEKVNDIPVNCEEDCAIPPYVVFNICESFEYPYQILWSENDPTKFDIYLYPKNTSSLYHGINNKDTIYTAGHGYVGYANNPAKNNIEKNVINNIKSCLLESLPEYMIPVDYVVLDSIPINANGKVDRKALPAPDVTCYSSATYVAPRNAVEKELCSIWRDVLGAARVGVTDNFFDIGGHSLLAVRVLAKIRTQWNVEIPLKTLFSSQTIQELSLILDTACISQVPPILKLQHSEKSILSYAQQRLWLLDTIESNSNAYNIPLVLTLTGTFNLNAFRYAVNEIINRHEVLRTVYGADNGMPYQEVLDVSDIDIDIDILDACLLDDVQQQQLVFTLANEEAMRPFDLSKDFMLRACVLKHHETNYIIFLTLHHIAADGWSIGILFKELGLLYKTFLEGKKSSLPSLPIQYRDYAHWQRTWLIDEVLDKHMDYWLAQLKDLPAVHAFPLDKPRPAQQSYRGAHVIHYLDSTLKQKLDAMAKSHEATLFMLLNAAFACLLHRHSDESDIVIGTSIANREQTEIAQLIGFFVNTLVMRTTLHQDMSFKELLEQTKMHSLDAYEHQQVPFEKLVDKLNPERNLSYSPLFQVMLVFQNNEKAELQLPEMELKSAELTYLVSKYDLTLYVSEKVDGLHLYFEYATDLFEEATIRRIANRFSLLLNAIVHTPNVKISEISLVDIQEQKQFLEWNNTCQNYPKNKGVHELFEQQVLLVPNNVAVVFKETSLTYRELNDRANQLANFLVLQGVTHETLVAICLERSLDLIVGLLAIMKAGGAYVPLDPDYPADRLGYMLNDSKVKLILSQTAIHEKYLFNGLQTICLDDKATLDALNQCSTSNVKDLGDVLANNLVYVIYTSGSTGKPKGVMIEHSSLVNLLCSSQNQPGMNQHDTLLAVTSISFDIHALELYLPLISGGKLVIASSSSIVSGRELKDLINIHHVNIMQATPSTWKMMLEDDWSVQHPLKVLCGGEALTAALKDELIAHDNIELWNMFGPTETTVWSSVAKSHQDVFLGGPLANTEFYILDHNKNSVPIGGPGELYIGGVGLARGYLNNQPLTNEKFITHHVNDIHKRLYRTGDSMRWRADGKLEFLGRIDQQVKVRGFRIELGEIEHHLLKHDAIRDAVVVAKEKGNDKYLVAYVTLNKTIEYDESLSAIFRTALKQYLPDYMVPSLYVALDAIPLTPNGKVDRKSLPAPDFSNKLKIDYVAPRTAAEKVLCDIWQNILGISPIGIFDNFFDLGGHSLLAVKAISQIERIMAINISVKLLFQETTIADLGRFIDQKKSVYATSSIIHDEALGVDEEEFLI